jgi:hypothetical protein
MDRKRFAIRLAWAVLLTAAVPGFVHAQLSGMGGDTMPKLGSMAMPQGQMFGSNAAPQETDPPLGISESFVAWIDSAAPRNVIGFRFDGAFHNRQPMRAEYLHPSGGIPNANGFPLMETKISYQELTSFAEYSITPWFSGFVEGPYRWLNPDINENRSGAGDMRYGLKLCTYSQDHFIATILVRLYQPSARVEALGTGHWSIEPGLLLAYQMNEMLHFEGELRYWIPLTGDEFAGEVARYGLGLAWGQRASSGLWYMPVIEGIGWTVMNGKTAVAYSADNYLIQEAHGQTIANGYLGVRWGHGANLDFYAGYGRSFTGHFWARDQFRFEIRYSY